MYIFSENEREIINTDFVERFCISEKPDASLIIASYGAERAPVTIGRYKDYNEAKGAFGQLLGALINDHAYVYMPPSSYYSEEPRVKDARTKRKGGS